MLGERKILYVTDYMVENVHTDRLSNRHTRLPMNKDKSTISSQKDKTHGSHTKAYRLPRRPLMGPSSDEEAVGVGVEVLEGV